jgi:exodeoxyribonuclease V beta subunit
VAWFEDAGERRARNGAESIDETAPVQLRAARSSGVFLHELLERVPLASFAGGHADGGESAPGWCKLDEWRSRVDVSTLVDEAIVVHRVDREQRDHAERLVWAAYTTSVTLPRGGEIRGFAEPARVTRETDFAYPIPEESGPLFGDVAAGAHPIRRGYVRGSLDLAFEHQGLTYFVDWKSDSLVSYEPGALGLRVAAHYADQVKLYALAVVRLLRVRTRADHEARFGGLLYCFLRGLGVQGHGVWSSCPSWDDVLRWDDELRARRRWGDPER